MANATHSPSRLPVALQTQSYLKARQGNLWATDGISERLIFRGLGLRRAVAPRTVTLTLPAQPPVQVLVVWKGFAVEKLLQQIPLENE